MSKYPQCYGSFMSCTRPRDIRVLPCKHAEACELNTFAEGCEYADHECWSHMGAPVITEEG